MRLKRGVERESCDFCHGRKIKCNRVIRASSGIATCSACERREIPCVVDDSSDIRLQRRRLRQQNEVQPIVTAVAESVANPVTIPYMPQEPQIPEDTLFDLNPESVFFLDQAFMGDFAAEWTNGAHTGLLIDFQMPSIAELRPDSVSTMDHYQDLWQDCTVSSDDFLAATHAYFDYAALSLPMTFEDAFWSDVQARTASAVFVCAVACRGMPFTQHQDKWILQQRLANKFKSLFLQKQQETQRITVLDDIEALALMVGFPYQEAAVGGLERLFLSRDALVLMTLQLGPLLERSSLSRASERHSLLFWHVYGLDAFACLDAKTASRIPETEPLPAMNSIGSGYLDAVLSLALVARAILQKLCGSAGQGVKYVDIDNLYKQLEFWKDSLCPHRLRDWRNGNESDIDQHLQVQLAVLHLLRINCYMQIENWVEEHGIDATTMADQMTCPRIEYESLRVLNEGVEIAKWMDGCRLGEFKVVDLAPNILRDICAGLGVWTCLHGRRNPAASLYHVQNGSTTDLVQIHLDIAAGFRSTVEGAVSHCDTDGALSRIDEQMAALRESVV